MHVEDSSIFVELDEFHEVKDLALVVEFESLGILCPRDLDTVRDEALLWGGIKGFLVLISSGEGIVSLQDIIVIVGSDQASFLAIGVWLSSDNELGWVPPGEVLELFYAVPDDGKGCIDDALEGAALVS